MNKTVAFILAVVAGIIVAGAVVYGVEMLGMRFFPPPPGLDPKNPADAAALMEQIPLGALLFVLLAWVAGTVFGGLTARAIGPAGSTLPIRIVAIAVLAGAIWTMAMLPHPLWFRIVSVAAIIVAGFTINPKRTAII